MAVWVLEANPFRKFYEALGGEVVADQQIGGVNADFGTIAQRLGLDRPRVVVPGNPRGRLRALLEERRPLYEQLATVTVQTDDGDPDELAQAIAAQISDPR